MKNSQIHYWLLGVTLITVSLGAVALEETAVCRGEYWAYKFVFLADKCEHVQKTFKDIPGSYKKNHVNKFQGDDQLSLTDCWKSMAQIQMDGAKCCWNDSNSFANSTSCKRKKIVY